MNIETALKEAMVIDGALGVALVDYESGMSLGTLGGGPNLDLELAAAGNTEVVRSKIRTLASLNMDDTVEDILNHPRPPVPPDPASDQQQGKSLPLPRAGPDPQQPRTGQACAQAYRVRPGGLSRGVTRRSPAPRVRTPAGSR